MNNKLHFCGNTTHENHAITAGYYTFSISRDFHDETDSISNDQLLVIIDYTILLTMLVSSCLADDMCYCDIYATLDYQIRIFKNEY